MEQLDLFARPRKRVMMVEKSSVAKPYQPSNGIEGEWFESEWCEKCALFNGDFDSEGDCCSILVDMGSLDSSSPEYPRELVCDMNGPRCTAFRTKVAKYQPSNGTEGDWFEGEWCAQCAKWNDGCDIHCLTLFYDVDSPEYPKEWVKDDSGPRCTAFSAKDLA